jgi:molybdopterin-guanine dinucleotide biosynthesis protein B
MKILNIQGMDAAEHAAVAVRIVEELERRGYSVGVISEEDYKDFVKKTGSGPSEIEQMLDFYKQDYVIIKGRCLVNCPNIVTASCPEEVDKYRDDLSIAVSGKFAETFLLPAQYKDLPIFNALTLIDDLVTYLEEKVPDRMPNYPADCCTACGTDCRGMTRRIIDGTGSLDECILRGGDVQVFMDGKEIPMVPFVKRLVKNVSSAVVRELDGYNEHAEIVIKIRQ